MSESTALVPIKVTPPTTTLPTKSELNIIGTIAKTVVGARGHAVPKELDTPAKAAAVMLAGWEVGLKPMTSLRHVFVVNGRTDLDAQAMAGIIQAREHDARFLELENTGESCTVRFERPSRGVKVEITYTKEDAVLAGLWGQGVWKAHPKDKLRYACVKRLARAYAPDLINSITSMPVSDAEAFLDLEDDADEGGENLDRVESLPAGELSNEGDDIEDEAFAEGEYEEAAPAGQTERQRSAISDWQDGVRGKHGDAALAEIVKVAKERFPYAVDGTTFRTSRLTAEDSDAYIAMLKEREEQRFSSKAQQAPLA